MPNSIEQIKERLGFNTEQGSPIGDIKDRLKFNTTQDRSITEIKQRLGFQFPEETFEQKRLRIVGKEAISKDVPPPDESFSAQFRKFSKDPLPFEVKAGKAIEKSFRTNEIIAEMVFKAATHPFTKEGRSGKPFKLDKETIDLFKHQPETKETVSKIGGVVPIPDALLDIASTQGRFRKIAEERLGKTRGGHLEILPDTIFGVPTAEIPRKALVELSDFFGGFMTNPKQPLVITPVLSSILGLTKLGIIKVLRKIADRMKSRRGFTTMDAFKEIETEVIKQGGKPKLLAEPKQPKLLPEFKSEVGALDIEPLKEAPVFFSKLQKSIAEKMPVKATAEMVRNIAIKGAKAEEVKWSGIQDFLKDKKNVTKQEVLDFLKANEVKIEETVLGQSPELIKSTNLVASTIIPGIKSTAELIGGLRTRDASALKRVEDFFIENIENKVLLGSEIDLAFRQVLDPKIPQFLPTKFEQYQVPGGENYKELLLRLPEGKKSRELVLEINSVSEELAKTKVGQIKNPKRVKELTEKRRILNEEFDRVNAEEKSRTFAAPHFDEPNILSHVRSNERISNTGEKVLFIEEIQSMWAQKGRKEGFREVGLPQQENFSTFVRSRGITDRIKIERMFKEKTSALFKEWRELQDRIIAQIGTVPEAPLLKNWELFTLKRMLREAVNKGFDRLAWITGKQTADRYNVRLLAKEIQYISNKDGSYNLRLFPKSGGSKDLVLKNHAELETTVGKEIADRILNNEGNSIRLSIDTVQPQAGDISKTLEFTGSLTGEGLEVGGRWAFNLYDEKIKNILNKFSRQAKFGARVEKADLVRLEKEGSYTFHEYQSIPITDAMKKVATEEGFELFAGVNPFKLLPKSLQTKAQEFWMPFSTLPKSQQVLSARTKGRGTVRRGEDFIIKLKKRIDAQPLEVRKEIFKYLDDTIDITDLPETVRVMSKSIRSAQDRIGRALVKRGLLTQAAYDALKGKYVHYIYARNILGDVDIDPTKLITPSGQLDMSYLKSRNPNLTHVDRRALGLIEDAGVAVPVGMGKALTDIAKFDYLSKLVDPALDLVWEPSTIKVGNQTWGISKLASEVQRQSNVVSTNVSKEIDNKPAIERLRILSDALEKAKAQTGKVPKDFRQIPDSAKFGNLAGAFVRKEIYDDIMPLITPLSSNAGAGRLLQVAAQFNAQVTGLFKAGKVALNPPTMFRNSVSNILQNNMRGRNLTLIPKDFLSAVISAIKRDSHWTTAKRNGLFETNWTVGELNEVLRDLNTVNASDWSSFLNFIGKISRFYGKIDDLAKFTIYKQLRTTGNLNILGIGNGVPATIDEAILEAQKWGMDYSLASRSIKHLRRQILPFGTYQYKIAPLILESLQKRPWVIGKFMAFLGIGGFSIAQELVKNYFDVDEREWEKMLRDLPHYIKKNKTFSPLPWKSPEGYWQWVNGEYYMPWGTWSTIVRDLKQGEIFEAFKSAGFGNPLLSVFQMINSATFDKPPIDPFTKQPIWNQLDTPQAKFIKLSSWLSNQIMPSVFENIGVQDAPRQGAIGTSIRTIKALITGKPAKDKWGRTLTIDQAIGRWFGFNITSVSPRQTKIIKKSRRKILRKELMKKLYDPRIPKDSKQQAKKRYIEGIKRINENK